MATSSNTNLKVELKMKCFVQLARKCIVDNLEEEIEKTDDDELREALVEKLTEVLENDIIFDKPRNNTPVVHKPQQRIPTEPVNVRGTPLKLKNMSNSTIYRNFCKSIADLCECAPDFSDTQFSNMVRYTRVYEAIKRLYNSGKIDQDTLDQLVKEAEEM